MTVPSKHPRENLPEAARVVLPVELGPTVTIMSINKNILSLMNATLKFFGPGNTCRSDGTGHNRLLHHMQQIILKCVEYVPASKDHQRQVYS